MARFCGSVSRHSTPAASRRRKLRSRPATRSIPIVVLTAKGDEDNEVRVFELGADDFITKPFRAKALSARLEAVLGRHRA